MMIQLTVLKKSNSLTSMDLAYLFERTPVNAPNSAALMFSLAFSTYSAARADTMVNITFGDIKEVEDMGDGLIRVRINLAKRKGDPNWNYCFVLDGRTDEKVTVLSCDREGVDDFVKCNVMYYLENLLLEKFGLSLHNFAEWQQNNGLPVDYGGVTDPLMVRLLGWKKADALRAATATWEHRLGLPPGTYTYHCVRSGAVAEAIMVGDAFGIPIFETLARLADMAGWEPDSRHIHLYRNKRDVSYYCSLFIVYCFYYVLCLL